jgi:hypothetical protein
MQFPEKEIYAELIAALKAKDFYFNSKGHRPPAHFDLDREQYLSVNETNEYPFARPALFFSFGEMEYEAKGSYNRLGVIPIEVIVVQDKFVDSADDAATLPDFLKLLEYKYLINDVLDHFQGECIGTTNLMSIVTDKENTNLLIERVRYSLKATLIKQQIPSA